jgi:hypothetical protein
VAAAGHRHRSQLRPGEYSPDIWPRPAARRGAARNCWRPVQGPAVRQPFAPMTSPRKAAATHCCRSPAAASQRNSAFQAGLVTDPNTLERLGTCCRPFRAPHRPAAQSPGQFGYITDDAPAATGGTPRGFPRRSAGHAQAGSAASAGDVASLARPRRSAERLDLPNRRAHWKCPTGLQSQRSAARASADGDPKRHDSPRRRAGARLRTGHAGYDPGNGPPAAPIPSRRVYRPAEDQSRTTTAQAVMPQLPGGAAPAPIDGQSRIRRRTLPAGLAALEQQRQSRGAGVVLARLAIRSRIGSRRRAKRCGTN